MSLDVTGRFVGLPPGKTIGVMITGGGGGGGCDSTMNGGDDGLRGK